MGVPSPDDPDRGAAPNTDVPVSPRALSPTGLAEGTDQLLADLMRVGDQEQTALSAMLKSLGPKKDVVEDEIEPVLAQPEHEPLDFVMRAGAAAPRRTSGSDDTRFVVSLIGNQPAPPIETESAVFTAIPPVLRRRQRMRLAAGALAATVAIGAAGAVVLTRGHEAPQAVASAAAKANEPPPSTIAPPPSTIVTPTAPSANPSSAQVAVAVPPEPASAATPPAQVAIAVQAEPGAPRSAASVRPAKTSTSSKRATSKKTVALKSPTGKKQSATKTLSTAKTPAKATANAKVTTAKTSSTAKKSSTGTRPTTSR